MAASAEEAAARAADDDEAAAATAAASSAEITADFPLLLVLWTPSCTASTATFQLSEVNHVKLKYRPVPICLEVGV